MKPKFIVPMLLSSLLAMGSIAAKAEAAPAQVTIIQDAQGAKLQVEGKDFLIKGMNWGAIPVGENYAYDLWSKPDSFITEVLDTEMAMMKSMGVNAIRLFSMPPPRWVQYIYERYGIYTVVTHLMGRYGFSVNGVWIPSVDYSDPKTREAIKADVLATVEKYKDTPGVLMWMLGNENNYGLVWTSSEIENLPVGERDTARATFLYSLFGEVAKAIKATGAKQPVSMANGDIQYLELIAKHVPDLDVLGTNVYRGKNATDLFEKVKAVLNKPVYFSEFGSDAFNAKSGQEDGLAQAEILKSQWLDIYENSYGQGKAGNAVGGFIFQWSDEWWKYKQTEYLEQHDQTASWANGGYAFDFEEGKNNMNEEWFGITAKTKTDARGRYKLSPRPAYYVLKQVFANNPYDPSLKPGTTQTRIADIDARDYVPNYDASRANVRLDDLERIYLRSAQIRLESIQSNGKNTNRTREGWQSYDHQESMTLDFGWRPSPELEASAAINILGNVAGNKMDEIFYENRGRPIEVRGEDGGVVTIRDNERVKLHNARFEWNDEDFLLEGFYRTGHGHWADEGDFFGLYQETWDLDGIDRYNSDAPSGMVFTGKKSLTGLKVAAGPQIYWGAKPMAIVKYQKQWNGINFAAMHQEAFAAQQEVANSSLTDPGGRAGKSSFYLSKPFDKMKVEWGVLQSGSEKIGDHYTKAEETDSGQGFRGSDYRITDDARVTESDTWATKLRLVSTTSSIPWYVAGAYRGLVANGGGDASIVVTKWALKPSERGNQYNVSGGMMYGMGYFSVAPQVIYQKPLVDALPPDPSLAADAFDAGTGTFQPGLRPRNLLNDTFAVLDNREMTGAELLFVYDPTPDSWIHDWNNSERETASFAASLDIIYRKLHSNRDANLGVLAGGQVFAFGSAPPAEDLWDAVLRTVHVFSGDLRVINQAYGGTGQANGDSPRLVKRYGLGSTVRYRRLLTQAMFRWNDWGPYDYHRDYNLTFPFQGQIGVAYGIGPIRFDKDVSQVGMRYQMRTLDKYSPRYPYALDSEKRGSEEEWTTYVEISI